MIYTDAATDCVSRSGTLAMATNSTTYETLRELFRDYQDAKWIFAVNANPRAKTLASMMSLSFMVGFSFEITSQ